MESRIHVAVQGGRVHPSLPGWEEKEIWTPRGEGLYGCWELVCRGGSIRQVVAFLKGQQERMRRRVTAICRTGRSTWVVDVKEDAMRISHFRSYAPNAERTRAAMLKSWARRKGGEGCIN